MSCDCLKTMNDRLAERNTKLPETLVFSKPSYLTVTLTTELVAKKRGARAVGVIPTFCPFCGTRYQPEPEPEAA